MMNLEIIRIRLRDLGRSTLHTNGALKTWTGHYLNDVTALVSYIEKLRESNRELNEKLLKCRGTLRKSKKATEQRWQMLKKLRPPETIDSEDPDTR